MGKIGKINLEQHSKSQFQSLCKLGEIIYRLTPTFKNVGNLHKISKAGHILNLHNELDIPLPHLLRIF